MPKKQGYIMLVIGTVLLIIGILLAVYPWITNIIYEVQKEEVVTEIVISQEETEAVTAYMDTPYRIEQPNIILEFKEDSTGVLTIPALDLMFYVGYGIETKDINKGPSFYPQSQHPEIGNTSIAGHRTTYGAPFRRIDELSTDNMIMLLYEDIIYIYQVSEVRAITKTDWSVIDNTEEPSLTLTTCHPPGWATERLMVRGILVEINSQER